MNVINSSTYKIRSSSRKAGDAYSRLACKG